MISLLLSVWVSGFSPQYLPAGVSAHVENRALVASHWPDHAGMNHGVAGSAGGSFPALLCTASGTNATCYGVNATATATDSSSFGESATATGTNNTVMGQGAASGSGGNKVVIGESASGGTTGTGSVVIGQAATSSTSGTDNVVIGRAASGPANTGAVVVGQGASASGADAGIVIGRSASTTNTGIAIGQSVIVQALNSVSIQPVASNARTLTSGASQTIHIGSADANLTGTQNVIIGNSADVTSASGSISVGYNNTVTATANAVVLGSASTVLSSGGIAIGQGSTVPASATDSIAIGRLANTGAFTECVAIGNGAACAANDDAQIGSAGDVKNVKTYGTITSAASGSLGWTIANAADQACAATCTTSACVYGFDVLAGNVVGLPLNCADPTADTCICAGP